MSLFIRKSPADKLKKQYEALMRLAMLTQRGGDIVRSAELHAEAEDLLKQLDALAAADTK